MVLTTHTHSYEPFISTVVADGLPHEQIEIDLDNVATIYPGYAVRYVTANAAWDLTGDTYGIGETNMHGFVYLVQVPADYPGRDQYDRTTVFPNSSKKVPAVKWKIGRKYHIIAEADHSALHEGQLLIIDTGRSRIPVNDATPDAYAVRVHLLALVEAVSTTEDVVEYLGFGMIDDA